MVRAELRFLAVACIHQASFRHLERLCSNWLYLYDEIVGLSASEQGPEDLTIAERRGEERLNQQQWRDTSKHQGYALAVEDRLFDELCSHLQEVWGLGTCRLLGQVVLEHDLIAG